MTERTQLLKQINEVSFAVNDITLYLDTHPLDLDAMNYFSEMSKQRKQLLETYQKEFEPLTIDCACPESNNQSQTETRYVGERHWTWTDGPLPWEGGNI